MMLIVDFPEEAMKSWKFLSAEECEIMIDRVDKDRADAHITPFSLSNYLRQGLDWKIWLYAANFGFSGLVTYAVAYFLPTILSNTLGFSQVASLMLPAPVSTFCLYVFSPNDH
jgi:cyanate permease